MKATEIANREGYSSMAEKPVLCSFVITGAIPTQGPPHQWLCKTLEFSLQNIHEQSVTLNFDI